jgi:folate-binding Fe-S cluster repair protein YgfZ
MNPTTDSLIDSTLQWSCVVATGPEAQSFLQGQLSQDLATVPPDGVWSLLLAPDGVVITSLYVTPRNDGFALIVAREIGDVVLARLRRFLLRTKCSLELVDVDHGPFGTLEQQIAAGRPGPAEFALALTPQCFGASFVASSVSFTKGCFTGQELVGRLDARGSSVPWRLVRVTGPSIKRLNEVLTSKGPSGTSGLTSSVRSGESIVGLGIAHRSLLGSAELESALDVRVQEIA